MTVKEYCNSCQNKGSHKCHSCCGKYYDGVLQGKPTKYRKKQQTNADRIRAMSDEELADFITDKEKGWCTDIGREMYYQHNLEWLKQPAEE